MEKPTGKINLYLGNLKEPWVNYCKSLGLKPGAALRQAVEKQLQQHGKMTEEEKLADAKQYTQTKEAPDDEPKFRYEILLTESELKALTERAEAERTSKRRWIVDAIRIGLTNEAQFSMDEIDALGESNYQLLALGRNLNQIAKAINQSGIQNFDASEIQKIRQLIDKHTEKVSTAIGASIRRWLIE